MGESLFDALEDCIERLQAGASLDEVLALYPELAGELRPLLESAQQAHSLRISSPPPQDALARSRERFLEMAAALPRHEPFRQIRFRFNSIMVAVISVIVILAVGSTFASANTVPGDFLYPVKIAEEQTRLLLTANSVQRLILEESYEENRVSDVQTVLREHRSVDVIFVGLLTNPSTDHWQVASIEIEFSSASNPELRQLVGQYVEVYGQTRADGIVNVTQIELHEFSFSGIITRIGSNLIYVDGIGVHLVGTTIVRGQLSIGAQVSVKAFLLEDSTLKARWIDVTASGTQEVQGNTVTEPAPVEESTATEIETVAPSATSQASGGENTSTQPTETETTPSEKSAPVTSESTPTSTTESSSQESTVSSDTEATLTPTPAQSASHEGDREGSGPQPTPTPTPRPTPSGEGGGD